MSLEIRNLSSDQYSDGISLFCNAMGFPSEFVSSMVDTANFYNSKDILHLIGLFNGSEMVGFGSIAFHTENTWIPWVGVDPKFQGNGYGKIIMNTLIDRLHERGRSTVELCASNAGYPLYEKLGFKYEYRTDILTIKGSKDVQIADDNELIVQTINTGEPLPEWVISMDRENMGVNRKNYLGYHFSEEFVIIGVENKGFGMLTGKRLGPLISKEEGLAKNIFQTAMDVGLETIIPVELPGTSSFVYDLAEIEMFLPCRKMTFGPLPNQNYDNVYSIRSTALG